jgi:ATPase subunit of ABC transporter with duplicated ATPase domains
LSWLAGTLKSDGGLARAASVLDKRGRAWRRRDGGLWGMKTIKNGAQLVWRTQHLTKHHGQVVGLEDLNLEMRAGEVLGYLGPNGAGKTTTIRLLHEGGEV